VNRFTNRLEAKELVQPYALDRDRSTRRSWYCRSIARILRRPVPSRNALDSRSRLAACHPVTRVRDAVAVSPPRRHRSISRQCVSTDPLVGAPLPHHRRVRVDCGQAASRERLSRALRLGTGRRKTPGDRPAVPRPASRAVLSQRVGLAPALCLEVRVKRFTIHPLRPGLLPCQCVARFPEQIVAANWDCVVFDLGSGPLQRVPMMILFADRGVDLPPPGIVSYANDLLNALDR